MGTYSAIYTRDRVSLCNNPLDCGSCDMRVAVYFSDDSDVVTNPTSSDWISEQAVYGYVQKADPTQVPDPRDRSKTVSGLAYTIAISDDAIDRLPNDCDICWAECYNCITREYLRKEGSGSPYEIGGDGGDGVNQTQYCFDFSDECIEFPVEALSVMGCAGKLFDPEEDGTVTGAAGGLLADALNCNSTTGALGWWSWSEEGKTLCVYSFGEIIKSLNIKSANGKELCLEPSETVFNDPLIAYQQAAFAYSKEKIIAALGTADCFTDDGDDVDDGGDDSGDCAFDAAFTDEFMRRIALHIDCGTGQPDGKAGAGHGVWEIDEETDINSVITQSDGSPLIEGDTVFKGKGADCERFWVWDGDGNWCGPYCKHNQSYLESPLTLILRNSVSLGQDESGTLNVGDYATIPPCATGVIIRTNADNATLQAGDGGSYIRSVDGSYYSTLSTNNYSYSAIDTVTLSGFEVQWNIERSSDDINNPGTPQRVELSLIGWTHC